MATSLSDALARPGTIPELALAERGPGFYGEASSHYRAINEVALEADPAWAQPVETINWNPNVEVSPDHEQRTSDEDHPSRVKILNLRRKSRDRPSMPDPIAIIGVAGRYPQAPDLATFWRNLAEGRDCVGPLPETRRQQRPPGEPKGVQGGWLTDVAQFDSLFFNITPREAANMDPQERLFLEVAWQALENAGYHPATLPDHRRVGVFAGAVWTWYQNLAQPEGDDPSVPNSFLWSIANRVSYFMDLKGPSLTLDTACSSSMTALHLACASLRSGECALAFAGGVNLDLHPGKRRLTRAAGVLSPDGRCRAFGTGANGYVPGEGAGVLLLKPLDRAQADGDFIHGVIRATAINHGGHTSGFAVPSPVAQAELIAETLAAAAIEPATIGYLEAHGTGTDLGDPIEIAGLADAFAGSVRQHPCPIGSVKTNIGHLEAAAGVAGITKVLLQMKTRPDCAIVARRIAQRSHRFQRHAVQSPTAGIALARRA